MELLTETARRRANGPSILAFQIIRIVLATFLVVAPIAAVLVSTHVLLDKSLRFAWPQILAAAAAVLGYCAYVKLIEKRAISELGLAGAWRELGGGVAVGMGLLILAVGAIALMGGYSINGISSPAVLIGPFAEMVLVATFEELLFRGVLFRISEGATGTWIALGVSSAIFTVAHLPNAGISPLAILFTFIAGATLAAAYVATRRLWLPIGIHFAWNFTSDAVLSLPTSGHAAKGLIQGHLAGAEWLTGGAYGVEGAAVSVLLFAAVGAALLWAGAQQGNFINRAARQRAI